MSYSLKMTRVLLLFLLSQSLFSQNEILKKETYRKIDSLFMVYNHHDKPGATLSIIKNEETIYKNHIGLANIENSQPITDTTVFNIASVSKQFTTFLALLLEQEGKLSFDDDIRQYLPELKELPATITIKQLTNHTHGLPNPDELAQLKGVKTMTHKEVLAMLLQVKQTNYLPGEKFEYNNTGYILLSEIIERVGQKPFKKQLKEKIFTPLKMKHTQAIDNNNIVISKKAYSYRLRDTMYVNYPVKLSTIGSSGIYTTINDLSLWAKNYHSQKVGKLEFYKKMETATFLTSRKKVKYGLGLYFDNYKGIDIVFHGGGTESYRSYILHVPKHHLSLVYLSNTGGFSGLDIIYKSLEILLKESIQQQKTHPASLSGNTDFKNLEGTYEMFPGMYYNIIAEKNKLYFQTFGSNEKILLPILEKNVFKVPFIPHSKFTFYKNRFDFRIADFDYPCKKTVIQLPKSKDLELEKFIGTYKNIEHNITYDLVVKENKLMAIHNSIDYNITLQPLAKNSFYSNEPFFGKIDFIFNANKKIIGYKLSGQNLNNIVFKKII
ncbi:serine hydrolase domain-containing protein [Aquimarina sediminis]|uniref:serine hydrolase domain-containing protein n=1 Tax=Aquimarina sediminis TaxID=2070536 RepID=UPI000CA04B34|nr:serine hydrolase domain-containing protein [Aquimarina sediminis]